jgi:drug/metabolite transporter (DMT)-like permease
LGRAAKIEIEVAAMRNAYLLMHAAILLWGFTGIFGRAIDMSEGMIVWYRMIISAVGLAPFLLRKGFKLPQTKDLLTIAGVGSLVALHWVLFYASIKASNVSIALSCFSTVSLFTAVLEPLFRRQKLQVPEILLSLCVIGGLYLIFMVRQTYVAGMLLAVASAFVGSLFTIFNKSLTSKHNAIDITFYELLTGFVILTLLLPPYFDLTDTGFQIPTNIDWVWLVLLSLLCTSLAFTISIQALKKLDAFTMNLSVNLEPLYSIVLAWFFFGEEELFSPGFIMGTMVILASVAFHTRYKWLKSKQTNTSI